MSNVSMFLAACLYLGTAIDQFRKGNAAAGLAFCGYAFSNLCFMGVLK